MGIVTDQMHELFHGYVALTLRINDLQLELVVGEYGRLRVDVVNGHLYSYIGRKQRTIGNGL